MPSVTWDLVETPAYARALRRFFRKHPDLRDTHAEVIRLLSTDPHAPSLRLYPLGGELAGQHAVSITYTYRITLILIVVEREIVLLNIGSHDEVYGGR
ncbi:MAG: plasmid stabilization protein [Chloroflexota bacterium]|nr:plasmid stabilization protein [Chloroflexota bacterium]